MPGTRPVRYCENLLKNFGHEVTFMTVQGSGVSRLSVSVKPTGFVCPGSKSHVALVWHKKEGGFFVLNNEFDFPVMRRHF
jgi:hypothetical protein